MFELQFHTAESHDVKSGVLHELYKEYRDLDSYSAKTIYKNKND